MAKIKRKRISAWKEVGKNLKGIREWYGFSDIEVSEKIGMEIKAYRRLEEGHTQSMTLKDLVSFMKLFDATSDHVIPF